MSILGLHHAGLVVANMDEAMAFYSDVLGFQPVRKRAIDPAPFRDGVTESGSATGQLLQTGWGYLELIEFQQPAFEGNQFFWAPVNRYGIRHLSLMVDDALEVFAYLREHAFFHGVPVPHSVEGDNNEAWSAYLRDPFGNILEFWKLGRLDPQPFAPGATGSAGPAPTPTVSHGILGLQHVAIVTPDLRKAADFYGGVLGFERVQTGPIEPVYYAEVHTQLEAPEAVSYVYNTGWGYLEVWEYQHPVYPGSQPRVRPCNKPGLSHFTLLVDDLAATHEHLGSQVEFRGRPGNGDRSVVASDPFGNAIEFLQPGADDPAPFAPAGS